MTLINRLSRLFRADLHAVLDRIEEPDLLLRQAVREMEEALGRDRRHLDRLTEEQRTLEGRRRELETSLARIGEELEVCFQADREDLARTLIRRRLEEERADELARRRETELARDLERLRARVAERTARLETMRQKAELLAAEDSSGGREEPWTSSSPIIGDEQVEVAFLRERRRRNPS